MRARTAAPTSRPWQRPGFQFLPLDDRGLAVWPPGYEPQAYKGMRTTVQTLARAAQDDDIRARRATGAGWGQGTLMLANTPTTLAPAEPPPIAPMRRAGWGVLPDSHIWLTLELIAHLRRPATMGEVAQELCRSKNIVRASLYVWIKRGVLRQVPSREQQLAMRGTHPPKDFARGAKAAQVWLREGARWA